MTTLVRRPHAPSLVDLFDWVEDGIPPLAVWPAMGGAKGGIRLEERREKNRYVLRAELPGVDPRRCVFPHGCSLTAGPARARTPPRR